METSGYNWSSAVAGVDQTKWEVVRYFTGRLGYVIIWQPKQN